MKIRQRRSEHKINCALEEGDLTGEVDVTLSREFDLSVGCFLVSSKCKASNLAFIPSFPSPSHPGSCFNSRSLSQSQSWFSSRSICHPQSRKLVLRDSGSTSADMAPVPASTQMAATQNAATTLMDLPTELRSKIYKGVFTKIKMKKIAIWEDRGLEATGSESHIDNEEPIFKYRFSPRHPFALLSVNKDINHETRPFVATCPIAVEWAFSGRKTRPFLKSLFPML